MFKTTLTAAALAMLLAGPAFADDDRRGWRDDDRYDRRHDDHDKDRRGRGHDKRDDRRHQGHRDDDRRYYYSYRDNDRRYYRKDWRPYYAPYHYRAHNHWRHMPPVRYSISFGYRSGYEQAWLDWGRYGRHDRYWRRYSFRGDFGFRDGYEAGWRDAARYYGDYGPGYWSRDPRGSWFFGFRIDG